MSGINPIVVSFGELLHRLDCAPGQRLQRAQSFRSFFTGAEANVGVLLSQLNIDVRFVTALPDNPVAQLATNSLRNFGVDTNYIHKAGERIGVFYSENGNSIRPSRVVYDRKYSSFASLTPGTIDWNTIYNGASWFHWSGISAALTQSAADTCLEALKIAKQKGMTISADMNYRSTLWDYGRLPSEIMPELLSYCDVLIGDIDTAEVYFGIKTAGNLTAEEKFKYCSAELQRRLPSLQTVAMSFRGTDASRFPTYRGAIVQKNDIAFTGEYTITQTVDRIGSGDAFTGGILFGLLQGQTATQTIDTAVACGVIKHSIEGDFCILSVNDIEQFIQNGPVNRVIR